MIITAKYAKKLVKQGQATEITTVNDNGDIYQAIDRHDKQRVDHYFVRCE